MTRSADKLVGRDAQRAHTRERVFAAATTEFQRAGMAEADIGSIVAAAGVARGTFYFHFPTKEHVLLELERREEVRITETFLAGLGDSRALADILHHATTAVLTVEDRLGEYLFKDALAVHFTAPRTSEPDTLTAAEPGDHPVIDALVRVVGEAGAAGHVGADVDVYHGSVFFLLGLYALLTTTTGAVGVRESVLKSFVAFTIRGLEAR